MTARPLVAAFGHGQDNVMENSMEIARNVEVWIFGAFGGLILAACLTGPQERTMARPVAAASAVSAVAETELAQPQGATQPMYVVYVVGKRLTPAEKRKAGEHAG
jgi:hypothetical protein